MATKKMNFENSKFDKDPKGVAENSPRDKALDKVQRKKFDAAMKGKSAPKKASKPAARGAKR